MLDALTARSLSPTPEGGGYLAYCPVHEFPPAGHRPSLYLGVGDDGHAFVKCRSRDCGTAPILRALGLQARDLYLEPTVPTVQDLATAKGLPVEFLAALGLHDTDLGVAIPYRVDGGTTLFERTRVRISKALDANGKELPRVLQPRSQPLMAYGLDRIPSADNERLFVVEGESDCWTLWFHGLPALGVPGASSTYVLNWGTLNRYASGPGHIYLVQENDAAGAEFVRRAAERIAAECARAHSGHRHEDMPHIRVSVLTLPAHVKDVNDLHRSDPEGFTTAWAELVEQATEPTPAATRDAPDDIELMPAQPWPVIDDRAYLGLAGDIVRTISPQSEADPVALLTQALLFAGNAFGSGPGFRVESTIHRVNEYLCLVGATAKARKGTSRQHLERLFRMAEETEAVTAAEREVFAQQTQALAREDGSPAVAWKPWHTRIVSGASSGEGIIHHTRDEKYETRPIVDGKGKDKHTVGYEDVLTDAGEQDKRLLLVEEEMGGLLTITNREGNTLSPILRRAWDSGDLRTLSKNSPLHSTGAHVSLIGHITTTELLAMLTTTGAANGFGNRILWICVRRSKLLPEGGALIDEALQPLVDRLSAVWAAVYRHTEIQMRRDEAARHVWRAVYPMLSADRPGLLGAMLARAEAHVTRLSCVYALLDGCRTVRARHLLAALALWQYAEASAQRIFGSAMGDPVADAVVSALRDHPEGMTGRELHDQFRGDQRAALPAALKLLADAGLVVQEQRAAGPKGGRPGKVLRLRVPGAG